MAAKPVGTTRTQRLRKLECDACGYIAYTSRRWIETGLPVCPCGLTLLPADPDDAALALSPAELDSHPAVLEYKRAVASVLHGQEGPARSVHGNWGANIRPADQVAAEKLERDRREAARARQLASLRRGQLDPSRQTAAAAVADMPF